MGVFESASSGRVYVGVCGCVCVCVCVCGFCVRVCVWVCRCSLSLSLSLSFSVSLSLCLSVCLSLSLSLSLCVSHSHPTRSSTPTLTHHPLLHTQATALALQLPTRPCSARPPQPRPRAMTSMCEGPIPSSIPCSLMWRRPLREGFSQRGG